MHDENTFAKGGKSNSIEMGSLSALKITEPSRNLSQTQKEEYFKQQTITGQF